MVAFEISRGRYTSIHCYTSKGASLGEYTVAVCWEEHAGTNNTAVVEIRRSYVRVYHACSTVSFVYCLLMVATYVHTVVVVALAARSASAARRLFKEQTCQSACSYVRSHAKCIAVVKHRRMATSFVFVSAKWRRLVFCIRHYV